MATVYSLLCWGGYSGKTVSISATTDIVTLANHGAPTGLKVWPSGTLPAELSALTPVYVRNVSSSTFKLYPTAADAAADTNQITFAGSSTYAAVVLSSDLRADPANALAAYGLSDLSRWDAGGGSYRIYAGIAAWNSARTSAPANGSDTEYLEVGEAFRDYIVTSSAAFAVTVPSARNIIRPKINDIYTSAWHGGDYPPATMTVDDGFEIYNGVGAASGTMFGITRQRDTLEDVVVRYNVTFSLVTLIGLGIQSEVNRCFLLNISGGANGACIDTSGAVCSIVGNVIAGFADGIYVRNFTEGVFVVNNLVTGCTRGFKTDGSTKGSWYNNIAIGNGTNWGASPGSGLKGSNNAGLSTDTPWGTGPVSMATTDFANYASNDFYPAASTSPQVNTGINTYGYPDRDLLNGLRPAYEDGTDTIDVGPYEWDFGNTPPNTVPISITSLVSGSRLAITKQSDGTEIYNDIPGTSYSDPAYNTAVDIPVYVWLRKGSAATYYHPLKLSATIDSDSGLAVSFSGLQNEDIAAHDYTGTAVATDWSFNLSTGAITHDSGTTRYSVQDLYSWHQDYTDGSTQVDDDPLMHGTTPTIFELINSGDISDADMEDLYGGSIEFPNGDLWTNLWTTDTMAAAHSVYVVQAGSKYTAFWGSGAIDVLLQVSDAGTLRDSGMVDVYVRAYGYTYAYYQADLSAGGRVVAPLATLEDATTQAISSATAAGYTDVGYTFGSTSQDLGEGGGAGTYYCRIDCAGRTLDQVFARTMYDCRDVSTTTLNSAAGWKYRKAHSSYVANDAAPFGNYSGGFWNVAQGVWLDNVASADQYNYKLTDHAGTTHQLTLPAGAATATVLDGSRVVLYNTTQDVEIDNVLMSGSTAYSYTITTEADTNDVLTLFVFKEGYEEASANMIWSGTTQSFVISQETHPYIAALRTELSITDYTTITEFAPDTTGHVYIEADDVDGSSQKARAAIWYNGILTTEGGARHFRGGMTILSTAAFRINVDEVDMLFENVNATTPLVFTDLSRRLYRSNGTSIIAPGSYSIHNDYSGVPDVVETGVSGLTGSESAQLMALPSASDIVTTAIDGTTTLAESLRLSNAVLGGKVSGAGTGTETFRNLADTKDRLVVTVDSSGNRTALTRDLT